MNQNFRIMCSFKYIIAQTQGLLMPYSIYNLLHIINLQYLNNNKYKHLIIVMFMHHLLRESKVSDFVTVIKATFTFAHPHWLIPIFAHISFACTICVWLWGQCTCPATWHIYTWCVLHVSSAKPANSLSAAALLQCCFAVLLLFWIFVGPWLKRLIICT